MWGRKPRERPPFQCANRPVFRARGCDRRDFSAAGLWVAGWLLCVPRGVCTLRGFSVTVLFGKRMVVVVVVVVVNVAVLAAGWVVDSQSR